MRKTIAFFLVVAAIAVAFVALSSNPESVEGRQKNVEYMRNRLGEVVLKYAEKNGELPEAFETALSDFDNTLPNRGDYFGRPMIYQRLSDDSFRFVAFGPNSKYDDGRLDDVVAEYSDGSWTDNIGPSP